MSRTEDFQGCWTSGVKSRDVSGKLGPIGHPPRPLPLEDRTGWDRDLDIIKVAGVLPPLAAGTHEAEQSGKSSVRGGLELSLEGLMWFVAK